MLKLIYVSIVLFGVDWWYCNWNKKNKKQSYNWLEYYAYRGNHLMWYMLFCIVKYLLLVTYGVVCENNKYGLDLITYHCGFISSFFIVDCW
jgi:hypothetical protein